MGEQQLEQQLFSWQETASAQWVTFSAGLSPMTMKPVRASLLTERLLHDGHAAESSVTASEEFSCKASPEGKAGTAEECQGLQ